MNSSQHLYRDAGFLFMLAQYETQDRIFYLLKTIKCRKGGIIGVVQGGTDVKDMFL